MIDTKVNPQSIEALDAGFCCKVEIRVVVFAVRAISY